MKLKVFATAIIALSVTWNGLQSQNILQHMEEYVDGYDLCRYDEKNDYVQPKLIVDFDINKYYPQKALNDKITKYTVYLLVYVDETGKCVNAVVKSPKESHGFNESALALIKRARFIPGRKNGKTIKMKFYMPITFVLN